MAKVPTPPQMSESVSAADARLPTLIFLAGEVSLVDLAAVWLGGGFSPKIRSRHRALVGAAGRLEDGEPAGDSSVGDELIGES
jgi:hypothetical protein